MSEFRQKVAAKLAAAEGPEEFAETISQLIVRIERAAELRAAVEVLPEPTLGKKGGISREAVLALIDEFIVQ
jgi:hypothetical protein